MFTFALVSLISTAVASIASGIIESQNQKAAAKVYDYQSKVEAENARMARQQGAYAEDLQRKKSRQQQAALRTTALESGVASGTFYDVANKSVLGAEMDALATRYNYETKAIDHLNQSEVYKAQAKQARKASSSALIGGFLGAGASTMNQAYTYWGT